jgi:flagellar biosynthesis/type III secretory pathway protein FliH
VTEGFVPAGAEAGLLLARGTALPPGLTAMRLGTGRGRSVLTVPEFDAEGRVASRPDPLAEAAAAAALAQAEAVAAAREAGLAEGEAAGRVDAAARHAAERATAEAAALAAAAASLARIERAADAAIGDAALAVARLLLAALDAALPAAAARLAADSAVHLTGTVRAALEQAGALTLHVAPGLAGAVAARLDDPRITVREDAALPSGDARAAWPDGEAVVRLAEQRQVINEALARLGLGLGLADAAALPQATGPEEAGR